MAIRQVHLLGAPALRERAQEVRTVTEEVHQLVRDLFETMRAYKGVGLAANQVGIDRRVAVVEVDEADPLVLIDPEIVEREGEVEAEEGCLSIPDIFGDVKRSARIVVETTTLTGERVQVPAEELKSRAIQHEIDHLDGILFIHRLSPLKRRMLLRKWRNQRKGETSLLREVPSTAEV